MNITMNNTMNNTINMRLAVMQDAVFIYEMMQKVHDAMEDPSMFICDDLEFVQEHIGKRGFTVVACDGERIVGSFIIRFPGYDEDNLGVELGLSGETLLQVVHMESAVVLPEYRGLHLQAKMLLYAQEEIMQIMRTAAEKSDMCERASGQVEPSEACTIQKTYYCMATAAPDNTASCRTLEQAGYQVVKTMEKYGGLRRRIYLKKVTIQNLIKCFTNDSLHLCKKNHFEAFKGTRIESPSQI